jgi:hypothetical protein
MPIQHAAHLDNNIPTAEHGVIIGFLPAAIELGQKNLILSINITAWRNYWRGQYQQ